MSSVNDDVRSKELYETRAMIFKSALSFDERARLAGLLRAYLDEPALTEATIYSSGADQRFMKMFFPVEAYTTTPLARGALARYGHTIAAAIRGDVSSLAVEALSEAARRGHIDRLVGKPPASAHGTGQSGPPAKGRNPPAAPDAADREKIKSEIRLLVLARQSLDAGDRARLVELLGRHYKKGPVVPENCARVAIAFLRAYYPEDYERERRRALAASARAYSFAPGAWGLKPRMPSAVVPLEGAAAASVPTLLERNCSRGLGAPPPGEGLVPLPRTPNARDQTPLPTTSPTPAPIPDLGHPTGEGMDAPPPDPPPLPSGPEPDSVLLPGVRPGEASGTGGRGAPRARR